MLATMTMNSSHARLIMLQTNQECGSPLSTSEFSKPTSLSDDELEDHHGNFNQLIDNAVDLPFTGPVVRLLRTVTKIFTENVAFINTFTHLPDRIEKWTTVVLALGAIAEAVSFESREKDLLQRTLEYMEQSLTAIVEKLQNYQSRHPSTLNFRVQNDMHDRIVGIDKIMPVLRSAMPIDETRNFLDGYGASKVIKSRAIQLSTFYPLEVSHTSSSDLFIKDKVCPNFSSQLGEGPHSFVYAATIGENDASVVVKIPKYFLSLDVTKHYNEEQNRSQLEKMWRNEISRIHSLTTKAASPHVISPLGMKVLSISSRSKELVTAVVMERATCTLSDLLHGRRPKKHGMLMKSGSNLTMGDESFYSRDSASLLSIVERICILRDVAAALRSLQIADSDFVHKGVCSSNVLLFSMSQTIKSQDGFNSNSSESLKTQSSRFEVKLSGLTTSVSSVKGLLEKKLNLNKNDSEIAYIAPELFVGKDWSAASDVYAFGTLINEVLTPDDRPYRSGSCLSIDTGEDYSSPTGHFQAVSVVKNHKRPILFYDCLADNCGGEHQQQGYGIMTQLRDLVMKAWEPMPDSRCSIEEMHSVLDGICSSLCSSTNEQNTADVEGDVVHSLGDGNDGDINCFDRRLLAERKLADRDVVAFDNLKRWLLSVTNCELSEYHAAKYSVQLLRMNIGSVDKLSQRIQKDSKFLERLGWKTFLVKEIQRKAQLTCGTSSLELLCD